MALYIERKYVGLISPRLERFQQKSEYLWNFRCPFCGDSAKSKLKARGYIYRRKDHLFYMCHNNCADSSMSFGRFVKALDPGLYKQMRLEEWINENPNSRSNTDIDLEFVKAKPVFANKSEIKLPTINSLPQEHYAKIFLKNRKIPKEFLDEIYFASDFHDFAHEIVPSYNPDAKFNDARIVIPFYDENKNLLGFQGRTLSNSKVKYITVKLSDANTKIYGLDRIDKSKTIYVVEGPIDSMFVDNSVATMDAQLYKIRSILGDHDYVLVFDREPRNPQICKNIEHSITMGYSVCLLPETFPGKDINDAIMNGLTSAIHHIIDENTYDGLKARLVFQKWKKV